MIGSRPYLIPIAPGFSRAFLLLLIYFLTASIGLAQDNVQLDFEQLSTDLEGEFAGKFGFSILIEVDNSVYSKSFGHLNKKQTIPVGLNTLFNIASISKSITAVGILKLVEENRIKLEDSLNKFFGNAPADKSSITIEMLLSHRSGLQQTYPLDGISDSELALNRIWREKLEFTPDSGFRYSNQNYQLLALIIEQITQKPFETYISEALFEPLEMKNTYFWDTVLGQEIASAQSRILNTVGKRNWGWIGGVGIFSTTDDLYKFWTGVCKNGFLTQESVDLLFGNYFTTQSGVEIGFGFFTSPDTQWNTPERWARGTESWGHNAVIRYFPDKDVTIIVVTNSGEIDNDRTKTGNRIVADRIADYLF